MSKGLKLAVECIQANKLPLNTCKIELVIFKSKNKVITKHINFRISGQTNNPHSKSNT